MAHALVRRLACVSILVLGASARAQEVGSRVPEAAVDSGASPPASSTPADQPQATAPGEPASEKPPLDFFDRFVATFSQKEDPDGPINTDRPTFTPANTVVPPGRLQFESGFTYNRQQSSTTSNNLYDLPELAMRYGLMDRVEFRIFWEGPTIAAPPSSRGRRGTRLGGGSDMEVGIKWQLFAGDKDRKWIPTTALITSAIAPTGGNSPLSSGVAEPYINLIYGWGLSEKLTLAGSTGYLGMRQQPVPDSHLPADSFQRFHQSVVAFYTVGKRTTLFYEWYVLMYTNATSNLPNHFMDGGLLYRLTPNIQIDLRAGFGLSGRPDDFFTGTGVSFRF
jgi:Putative MetA-pathway of phenol degradation